MLAPGFAELPDDSRIVALTEVVNLRSIRLLRALGMVFVDRFEEFGATQRMYAVSPTGVPVA